jgi:threonine synthase
MPEEVPKVSAKELSDWKYHSFALLCEEIMAKFVGDEIPRADLRMLMTKCFGNFSHESVVPLHQLKGSSTDDDVWLAELFHGPSLSFKDFGQQVLCNLLDYFARRRGSKVSLLVATTGDTGPAAICASAGLNSLQLVVTYPLGQISRVQELQMTTQTADNVYVFAFEGGGDDMDAPIKALSTDANFQEKHGLSSVNSINIGRVVAQTVHYFWSYLRTMDQKGLDIGAPLQFALPCGALGNASAGLLAKMMGLPVSNILCGTNINDIFHRAIAEGDFSRRPDMRRTLSEAINIQLPYNFERILYLVTAQDTARVRSCMEQLPLHHKIDLSCPSPFATSPPSTAHEPLGALIQKAFVTTAVTDGEMLDELKRTWERDGYLVVSRGATGGGHAAAKRRNIRVRLRIRIPLWRSSPPAACGKPLVHSHP